MFHPLGPIGPQVVPIDLDDHRTEMSPLQWKRKLVSMIKVGQRPCVVCPACAQPTGLVRCTKNMTVFLHCKACWVQVHARSEASQEWIFQALYEAGQRYIETGAPIGDQAQAATEVTSGPA